MPGDHQDLGRSQPTHESHLLLFGIVWSLFPDSPPPVMEVPAKTGVPAAPCHIPVFPRTLSEIRSSVSSVPLPPTLKFPFRVSFLSINLEESQQAPEGLLGMTDIILIASTHSRKVSILTRTKKGETSAETL